MPGNISHPRNGQSEKHRRLINGQASLTSDAKLKLSAPGFPPHPILGHWLDLAVIVRQLAHKLAAMPFAKGAGLTITQK